MDAGAHTFRFTGGGLYRLGGVGHCEALWLIVNEGIFPSTAY